MVGGHDAVDGGDGLGGVAFCGGLVLQGADGVAGDVLALHREQFLHDGERDVEALIVAVVVAAVDGLNAADDREADVVDGDGLTDHGAAGEEQ